MRPEDLVKVWDAPDHSRLASKQISIRLPMVAMAKINALMEMFPSKSKTQIISDLIATALDQLESGMSSKKGKCLGPDPEYEGEPSEYDGPVPLIHEDIGQRGSFIKLYKKNLRALEKEAGIKELTEIFTPVVSDDE